MENLTSTIVAIVILALIVGGFIYLRRRKRAKAPNSDAPADLPRNPPPITNWGEPGEPQLPLRGRRELATAKYRKQPGAAPETGLEAQPGPGADGSPDRAPSGAESGSRSDQER